MGFQKTNNSNTIYLLLLVGLVLLCAIKGLNHQFTNWDDREYILNNPLLQKSTSWSSVLTSFWMGNYHPLTILSYKFNFLISSDNPLTYILTNCLIHLINVLLVFYIAYYFLNNNLRSLAVAMLFAIHPIQMESLMWLSARKDLLYVMFYLLSFGSWVVYCERGKKAFYFIAILFFVFSLLSKAMAVSLPLVLFCFYWFKQKRFNVSVLVKLLPFIILSVLFGIIAVKAQSSQTGALAPSVDMLTKVVLVFSSIANYIIHIIFPAGLSALYPYPSKLVLIHWFFAFLGLGLMFLFFLNVQRIKRLYVFAFLFFMFNIVFVLQLFPVGFAIMADRYSYLASLGIFILGVDFLFSHLKKGYLMLFWLFAFVLILVSVKRMDVWKSSETLWSDVLSKYPESSVALINHGSILFENGKLQQAEQDFVKAYSIDSLDAKLNYNLGLIRMQQQRFGEAEKFCTKSILVDSLNTDAYYNRALSRIYLKEYTSALSDFQLVLRRNPRAADALGNSGLVYYNLGKRDTACLFWAQARKMGWLHGEAYISRFCTN